MKGRTRYPRGLNARSQLNSTSLLADAMQYYVQQGDLQPSPSRHGQLFRIDESGHKFQVQRCPETRKSDCSGNVTVEFCGTKLTVHSPQESFDTSPQRNEGTLTCDLMVDERLLDTWGISQRA